MANYILTANVALCRCLCNFHYCDDFAKNVLPLKRRFQCFSAGIEKAGKLSLLSYSHWKTLDPSWPLSFILVSPSESCYQIERKKKKIFWIWVFIRCLFFWRGERGLGNDFIRKIISKICYRNKSLIFFFFFLFPFNGGELGLEFHSSKL